MAIRKRYEWLANVSGNHIADNPTMPVSVYSIRPMFSCRIVYAYSSGDGWYPSGWRYGGDCWGSHVATIWPETGFPILPFLLNKSPNGLVRLSMKAYQTKKSCITAALTEVAQKLDDLLTLFPSIAVDLCCDEMEQLYTLLAPVIEHQDWLADCQAPKFTQFTQQMALF